MNGEILLVKFCVFRGHEVDFYKNKSYGIACCLNWKKNENLSKILEKYGVKRERFKRVNLHKNQCKINFDSENAVGGTWPRQIAQQLNRLYEAKPPLLRWCSPLCLAVIWTRYGQWKCRAVQRSRRWPLSRPNLPPTNLRKSRLLYVTGPDAVIREPITYVQPCIERATLRFNNGWIENTRRSW